jgi:RNA polymerase sigma factor for flagellar operon FliA
MIKFDKDLVEKYLPMIKKLASMLGKTKDSFRIEELSAAGLEGLYKASKKFDESKKISFNTFAYIKIKGEILDELRRTSWISTRKKGYKNVKLEFISDDYSNIDDFIEYEQEIEERDEAKAIVDSLLPYLNETELEIVKLRFYYDLTFQDISNIIDIDENNVSNILHKALDKLKEIYEEQNKEVT